MMAGMIKIITGEMFSGKSQELARLIAEGLRSGLTAQAFFPGAAARGSERDIDHRLARLSGDVEAVAVPDNNPLWVERQVRQRTDMVAIDEAQFFDRDLVDVVKRLRRKDKLVLIAGLDQDYQENPFGCMGDLMCIANHVTKFHAFCAYCQDHDAYISHRVSHESGQVVIGEHNYVPLCESCYARALSLEVKIFAD